MSLPIKGLKTFSELRRQVGAGDCLDQDFYKSMASDFKNFSKIKSIKDLSLDQQLKIFMPPYIEVIVSKASWTEQNYDEKVVLAIFMKALKELNYKEAEIELAVRVNEQELLSLYKYSTSKNLTLGLKKIDWYAYKDSIKFFAMMSGIGVLPVLIYVETPLVLWLFDLLCIFVLICGFIFAYFWGTRRIKWQGWLIAIGIIIIGQFFSLWEKLFN